MFDRTAEIHVACSPQEAFSHIALEFFENHPQWDPDIVSLTKTSAGPLGVGTTGREVRKAGGRRFTTDFRVTEFAPGRSFAHRSTSGAMGEDVDYVIAPDGEGTTVRARVRIYPRTLFLRLLTPLIRPQVERNFARNIARFEDMLNASAPSNSASHASSAASPS